MGKIEQLQDELSTHRIRLLEAIEPLPDEALLQGGVVGEWSIAELLAVLTAWDSDMVTALMRLDQGKKPGKLLQVLQRPDAYSEEARRESQGRSLDAIFDDFFRVRRKLEEWIEYFSDKDLRNAGRYKWFDGSLAQLIARTTFKREASYVPALKAYRKRWLAQEEAREETADQVIPVTAVSPQSNDQGEQP